ncbi:MAG TPA: DUF3592 domain-containing protein [Pseudogracilibacillus sp.]|nr:DUF3592 domain-containing protein [Pseudogracilibacillus sp.]
MDELKKGDTIQGISVFDRFFTVHELPYKLLQLFIILLIVSVFIFGFVILSIKKYNDYFYSETGRKKLIQVLKVIGVAAVIFLLFVTNKFVINMIHKVVPVSQTETIAIVRDTQASGGGRYSDPTYELTLRFRDSSKEVHTVKKEVTRTTYKKHRKGSLIYITYRNQNPKDLFISRTSFKDVIGIGLYLEFIFYFLTLLFLIIYIRRMFKTRKETSI